VGKHGRLGKRRLRGDLIAAFQYLRGACKKGGNRRDGFKLKEGKFRYKDENFYSEGGETLAQVAWRGGRCPIPGDIQGQAGRGSEQPDPVKDGKGVGLDGLERSLPTQIPPNSNHPLILRSVPSRIRA